VTEHFLRFEHHKSLISIWVISYASPIICCVYRKQVPYFLSYIYKLYYVHPLCNTNKEGDLKWCEASHNNRGFESVILSTEI